MSEVKFQKSYCRFCLSFCGVIIENDSNGIPIKVIGDNTHPLTKGYTCSKGRNLLSFYSNNRLLFPLKKNRKKNWSQVLKDLENSIKNAVDKYGKNSVALYAGTNATLDSTGMWAALGFMYRLGSKSIYTVSSIDAINKQILIEQATSFSSSGLIPQVDFDNTDLLLIVGSNLTVSHGHLAGIQYPGKRLRDIKKKGGQIIVADPQKTNTSNYASLHIRPNPGTDYAWLGYVIRALLIEDSVNHSYIKKFSNGIEKLKETVEHFDEKTANRITGLEISTLQNLVKIVKKSEKISGVSGTGMSFCDSGIVGEWFLWSLLIIRGSLDQKGGVWFNPGFTTDISKISPSSSSETIWSGRGLARPDLPSKPNESPVSGFADETLAKNIRILICVGGNPLTAFPDNKKTLKALNDLDVLVVMDTHKSDLVNIADFALPVSGQLERVDSSVYTQSSSSRVSCQFTDKVIPEPAEVKPVWWVFSKLGESLGLDVIKLNKKTEELTDYDVLKTIKGSGNLFDDKDFIQTGYVEKKNIPYGWVIENILPNKKWSLYSDKLSAELKRVLGKVNQHDLILVSMRERNHLNSQFIVNNELNIIPEIVINHSDASKYDIKLGDIVELHSEIGLLEARVFLSKDALVGTVGISHGFEKLGNVAQLTSSTNVNPLSGMVTQTGIKVELKKLEKS